MGEGKKWVFRELVANNGDMEGLIAYALYKFEKDQIASRMREDGVDDLDVDRRLREFHDQTLMSSDRLESYKEKATKKIYDSIQDAVKAADQEYRIELEKMQVEHNEKMTILNNKEKRLDAQKKNIPAKIEEGIKKGITDCVIKAASTYVSPRKRDRFWAWLKSGFAGYAAGSILVVIVLSIAAAASDKAVKDQLIVTLISSLVKYITNNPLPPIDTSTLNTPLPKQSLISPTGLDGTVLRAKDGG